MKYRLGLFFLIFSWLHVFSEKVEIYLLDRETKLPIADAAIYIKNEKGEEVSIIYPQNREEQRNLAAIISDDKGKAVFYINPGEKTIYIQHINYEAVIASFVLRKDTMLHILLQSATQSLREVVITASESKGISTSSIINRDAMEHLQPTSFTDLLSLLPGGGTSTPQMNAANLIQLREVGVSSDEYAVSSLGTSFILDGAPISTDGNMQYVPQSTSNNNAQAYNRSTVNKGVDMRTISTDEIEKVEIVRGIPSVEYGDLTSGLVKIERKTKATPWEARFKTDGFGKLFYVGKGFMFNKEHSTLNTGLDYLDAKSDPRNNLENYKRITGSARLANIWKKDNYNLRWNINADYTGSIDNNKIDPDLNYMREDSYHSAYNRVGLFNHIKIDFNELKILKSIQLDANISYQIDRIEQTRFVSLERDQPAQTNMESGEYDGVYLPYTYTAYHIVDGKPLNVFVKLKADFSFITWTAKHQIIAGLEWKMDKNYGNGQVFDITRPLFVPMYTRPRTFYEIPAGHQSAFFVEDAIFVPISRNTLKVVAGLRGAQLLNIDSRYAMHGKMYLDPRVNAQWRFPAIKTGKHDLLFTLSGGVGQHTKMPTLAQLYPATIYKDIIQLNYWHENADYRRLNILTYSIDPVNYDLQPAKNFKWEVRLGAEYNKNNFSVTLFRENMVSGFRTSSVSLPYSYKKYDASGIDHANITASPDVATLPYVVETLLDIYSQTTNGSKILKKGLEFQFASQRVNSIKTRFTVNGAWFRTTYENSQPMFYRNTSQIIDGVPVGDLYVGYYNWRDGSVRELFNTNLITDTYIEELGFTFSLTFQLEWYNSKKTLWRDGIPVAYMDNTGQIHPYTEADMADAYKQWLVIVPNSEAAYNKITTPFAGYINFKATKNITKYIRLAFFVDKLFDYLPDYKTSDNITIRRSTKPYFGMELNIKI